MVTIKENKVRENRKIKRVKLLKIGIIGSNEGMNCKAIVVLLILSV